MTHAFVPTAQQSTLAAGHAATWHTGGATRLAVLQGRAWVTIDGPDGDDAPRGGDWFVAAGEALPVPPGGRLVIEPAGGRGEALVFGWCSAPAVRPSGIAQPWRDLRAAVRLAATAGGRLALGLARWPLSAGPRRPPPRRSA